MTWTPLTRDDLRLGEAITLWIATARAAGYGGPDWLPSSADFHKSALFERIRSGKAPLPHPPPVGFACPWYAAVEDRGPHSVGEAHTPWVPVFHTETPGEKAEGISQPGWWLKPGQVSVLQQTYRIVETRGENDFVVADDHHKPETPYRFRLWLDRDWLHPSRPVDYPRGGWFLQNLEFGDQTGELETVQDNDPLPEAPVFVPEVTEETLAAAVAAGEARPRIRASAVVYRAADDRVVITLDSGMEIGLPRMEIGEFWGTTPEAMATIRLSPRGTAIELEAEDIDIDLHGLLDDLVRPLDTARETDTEERDVA